MTHVIKNTHGLAYVAFSNISSRLWSGDNKIWRILSIKEVYQVFIQAYNLLLLQRLKQFQSWTIRFDPYRPFKKKKKKSNCVWTTLYFFTKFLPETIRFKSCSPLKYFIEVSTKSSILFCIFKSCIFFSIYIILNKFESGTIRVDPYCPF